MRNVSIKTNDTKFYRQLLELLRSIPPITKLRPRDLDVLAEIMFQNNKYKDLEKNIRYTVIFSKKGRIEMREKIGTGEDTFNNNLSLLRKVKILSKDNILNNYFDTIIFDNDYSLVFNFKKD